MKNKITWIWGFLLLLPAFSFTQTPQQHFQNFLDNQGFDLQDPVFSVLESKFTANGGEAIITKRVNFEDGPYLVFFHYQYPSNETQVLGNVTVSANKVWMDPKTFPLFWMHCQQAEDEDSFEKASKPQVTMVEWDAGGTTNSGTVTNTTYEMGSRDVSGTALQWNPSGLGMNGYNVSIAPLPGGGPLEKQVTAVSNTSTVKLSLIVNPNLQKVILTQVEYFPN